MQRGGDKRLRSALLMSAFIAGVSYSQQNLNNTGTPYGQQQTASGALSQAVGQQFGTVIAQMVSKNMTKHRLLPVIALLFGQWVFCR